MNRHRTLLSAALVLALAGPAFAQPNGQAPVLNVGTSEHAISRKLDLSIGRSLIVELPRDAKEVFVANPKVA
ncbi:MAG: secretin, partial [Methylobacterium sp.]|nr:secretin [Methylobacterium sp.]